jgi:hypothetical protein
VCRGTFARTPTRGRWSSTPRVCPVIGTHSGRDALHGRRVSSYMQTQTRVCVALQYVRRRTKNFNVKHIEHCARGHRRHTLSHSACEPFRSLCPWRGHRYTLQPLHSVWIMARRWSSACVRVRNSEPLRQRSRSSALTQDGASHCTHSNICTASVCHGASISACTICQYVRRRTYNFRRSRRPTRHSARRFVFRSVFLFQRLLYKLLCIYLFINLYTRAPGICDKK